MSIFGLLCFGIESLLVGWRLDVFVLVDQHLLIIFNTALKKIECLLILFLVREQSSLLSNLLLSFLVVACQLSLVEASFEWILRLIIVIFITELVQIRIRWALYSVCKLPLILGTIPNYTASNKSSAIIIPPKAISAIYLLTHFALSAWPWWGGRTLECACRLLETLSRCRRGLLLFTKIRWSLHCSRHL